MVLKCPAVLNKKASTDDLWLVHHSIALMNLFSRGSIITSGFVKCLDHRIGYLIPQFSTQSFYLFIVYHFYFPRRHVFRLLYPGRVYNVSVFLGGSSMSIFCTSLIWYNIFPTPFSRLSINGIPCQGSTCWNLHKDEMSDSNRHVAPSPSIKSRHRMRVEWI